MFGLVQRIRRRQPPRSAGPLRLSRPLGFERLEDRALLSASGTGSALMLPGVGDGNAAASLVQLASRPVTVATPESLPTANLSIAPLASETVSFFPDSVPSVVDSGDGRPVNLGIKFTATTTGFVTAIRFFKSAANTGVHYGDLWSSTGQLLAQAQFTDETPIGWQQVNLATPVAITPGVTYTASYYAPFGHFSVDSNFYTTAHGNGTLLAPAGAGVYLYATQQARPSLTVNANYWVDIVFSPTSPADVIPPTVTSFAPASDTTNVSVNVAPVITFSEALNPATVNAANVFLTAAGNLVAATVAYLPASRQAVITPAAPLAVTTQYTITVQGGGVQDLAGNPVATTVSSVFITGTNPATSSTFFSPTSVPSQIDAGEAKAVNLGMKFLAGESGTISAVRFFKGPDNTGTHVGSLWDSAGNLLAAATFNNETASGWQQVNFALPVSIVAGAIYTVSYFTPNGHFSVDRNYFTTSRDSGFLHTPVGAGVYQYASFSAFPSNTFANSNYWVDVVFNGASSTDTTAPSVSGFNPIDAATNVAVNFVPTVTFSEGINPATILSSNVYLTGTGGIIVPTTLKYIAATNQVLLTPAQALAASTQYTIHVLGGFIKDLAGNVLAVSTSSSFTTSASTALALSFFSPAAVPSVLDTGEAKPLNLGMKFVAGANGYVTGVRFFKSTFNVGTHTGSLWTSTGELLATATFIDESTSGWQQVNFATPVAIFANTSYVVSYFTPSGHFSVDRNYFTAPRDSGYLHTQLAAGVYLYNSASAFPSNTVSNSNYWVDVVFRLA